MEVIVLKTLELQFTTDDNKTARISIEAPIEPVDTNQVKAAMADIIESNVFRTSNGSAYMELKGARLIENNITEIMIG